MLFFSTITSSDYLFLGWRINQVQTDSNFTEKLKEWFEYGILKLIHTVWIWNSEMSIGNSTMELETATKADAIKILAHTEWCDNEPYIRKKPIPNNM